MIQGRVDTYSLDTSSERRRHGVREEEVAHADFLLVVQRLYRQAVRNCARLHTVLDVIHEMCKKLRVSLPLLVLVFAEPLEGFLGI